MFSWLVSLWTHAKFICWSFKALGHGIEKTLWNTIQIFGRLNLFKLNYKNIYQFITMHFTPCGLNGHCMTCIHCNKVSNTINFTIYDYRILAFTRGNNRVSTPITKCPLCTMEQQHLKVHPCLAHHSKSDLWPNTRSYNILFEWMGKSRQKRVLCFVSDVAGA
jgi:hypothetical protein